MRKLLALVLDQGSLFESGVRAPDGHGARAPRRASRWAFWPTIPSTTAAGSIDADAAEKMARFVDLCDQFHLPVVNFVDVPGFLIGIEAERRGTIRRGARGLPAVYQATVPWVLESCARSSAWRAPAMATARA